MAQRLQMILEDDLTGGPAVETIEFAVDGVGYEIDLNAEHAGEFRAAVEPFVRKARKARKARNGQAGRSSGSGRDVDPGKVREWARSQGIEVKGRGRLSADLVARYRSATGA